MSDEPVKICVPSTPFDDADVRLTSDGGHVFFRYHRANVLPQTRQSKDGEYVADEWRLNLDGVEHGPFDGVYGGPMAVETYRSMEADGVFHSFGVDLVSPWFAYYSKGRCFIRLEGTDIPVDRPGALCGLVYSPDRRRHVRVIAREVKVFKPHQEPSRGVPIGIPAWAAVLGGIFDALPRWTKKESRFSLGGDIEKDGLTYVSGAVYLPDGRRAVTYTQDGKEMVDVDGKVYRLLSDVNLASANPAFLRSRDGREIGFVYREGGKIYARLGGAVRGPFPSSMSDYAMSADLQRFVFVHKKGRKMFVRVDDAEYGGYDQIRKPPTFSPDGVNVWFVHYDYDDFPKSVYNINGQDQTPREYKFAAPVFEPGKKKWVIPEPPPERSPGAPAEEPVKYTDGRVVLRTVRSSDGSKKAIVFRREAVDYVDPSRQTRSFSLYQYVEIDGREYGLYNLVDAAFSPRGETVLAYLRDGAVYKSMIPTLGVRK